MDMDRLNRTKVYDVAIINGIVVDVIEEKYLHRNIGISNGVIEAITEEAIKGIETIDASDLLVAPGFIDFHSHVDGNDYSASCLVKQGGTTTLGGERALLSEKVAHVEQGFIVNQGFSISQSFVLRKAVGITDPTRAATKEEIKIMSILAERFMESGAFALCFGLELVPGTSFEELVALSAVAKKYDRPIFVHLRKDGREALQYFDEIIQVARMTGVKVQILQLMYMVGIGGAMPKALRIIEDARAQGLDITADSGVYDAYSACIGTGIFDTGWEKEYGDTSVKDLIISSGIHVGENCNEELFSLLRERFPETLVTAFVCDSDAIEMALKKDYVYVSTNAADGPHYPGIGAPEVAGTYPRLLGRYVREKKVISLMEAIKKITILPAERFGINNIGAIEQGKNADIVIFDKDTIMDEADFIGIGDPGKEPVGIHRVLVNGKVVVKNGKITDNTHSGKLLKREV